jgi:hypothetical protein
LRCGWTAIRASRSLRGEQLLLPSSALPAERSHIATNAPIRIAHPNAPPFNISSPTQGSTCRCQRLADTTISRTANLPRILPVESLVGDRRAPSLELRNFCDHLIKIHHSSVPFRVNTFKTWAAMRDRSSIKFPGAHDRASTRSGRRALDSAG